MLVDGSLLESRRWFDAAYRAAESARRPQEMALAALGMGGLWLHERRQPAQESEVAARQRRALELLDPDSEEALRLRARRAAESDYRAGTTEAVLSALEDARRRGRPILLAESLSAAHHCLLGPRHASRRLELADELLLVATKTGRQSDALMGLMWRTVDLFLTADPRAERSLGQLRRALSHHNHAAIAYVAGCLEVMLLVRAGRFAAAETAAARCLEQGLATGDADATGWYAAHMLAIRWYQGRVAELLPRMTELVHSPTLGWPDISAFAGLATAAAAAGDLRQATGALARLRNRGLGTGIGYSTWMGAMYGSVEAGCLLADQETAAEAYELLLPFERLPMMVSLAVSCFGSTHHALGVASLAVAEYERAAQHFDEAVRDNQALGHWPAATLARHRLGEALAHRAGSVDAAAAAEQLATAAEEAGRLGMQLPPIRPSRPGRSGSTAPVARHVPTAIRRHGRRWLIQCGSASAEVADSVGMRYLATLVAHPGREIPAIELAGSVQRTPQGDVSGSASMTRQPKLDEQAVRQYRDRIAQLKADIDDAEAMNDHERASTHRAELEWLIKELSAATGLGARVRPFADNAERARISVGKAIRRALDRIGAADPEIADHVRARVTTGSHCCFDAT